MSQLTACYTLLTIQLFNNPQKLKLNKQQFSRVVGALPLSDRMHWEQKYAKKYELIETICKYRHILYILGQINENAKTQETDLVMSSEELKLLKSKNQGQGSKLQTSQSLIGRMRKRDGFDRILLIVGCLLYILICAYIVYRRTAAHIIG